MKNLSKANKAKTQKLLRQEVELWLKQFQALRQSAYDVCVKLSTICNEFGRAETYSMIQEADARMTTQQLDDMAACGSRQFPPQLLWHESPGAALLRKLPYAKAEQYLAEKIPVVVVAKGTGKHEIVWKSFDVITHDEIPQLAPINDGNDLKSTDAQLDYLKNREISYARPVNRPVPEPFFVTDGKVCLRRSVVLRSDEIMPFAERMIKALQATVIKASA